MRVYYPKLGEYPEYGRVALCKITCHAHGKTTQSAPMWVQAVYHENSWFVTTQQKVISEMVTKWCYMDELVPEAMR